MIKKYQYLQDSSFLKELDEQKIKQFYVNITILDWNQNPIEDIQGKVGDGSISIDGHSSVRRTISLNIIANEVINEIDSVENLLSINKKIFIQIGFKHNKKSNKYTNYDIIYFPMGVFVISSLSISHSINSFTISLQAQDKMCLLNGQCGGTFPASVVLDNYDTVDQNGQIINSRPSIYQIIRQMVNHFGQEDLSRIIISDLDTRVKQVMQWTGDTPLYFLQKQGQYMTTMNPAIYNELLRDGWYNILGSPFEYGSDVGYVYMDFQYPGDLIAEAGSTVTSILDQIIEVLGNYEYFYDIYGNFIFQEVKNFLNNSQTKYVIDDERNEIPIADYLSDLRNYGNIQSNDYLINNSYGKSVYSFENSLLIDSYTNNPQYGMIKNDYIVWGLRKIGNDIQIPIRYHLAIDKKPKTGNTYQVFEYEDPEDGLIKYHAPIKFTNRSSFPQTGKVGVFYLDSLNNIIYKWGEKDYVYQYIALNTQIINVVTQDWRTQLYFQGVSAEPYGTASNYYYTELVNEWPKLFQLVEKQGHYEDKMRDEIKNNPEKIDYYLDFIDSTSKIGEFQINNIGRRTAVLDQNDNINCVFEPVIPDIILLPTSGIYQTDTQVGKMRAEAEARNQAWIQVDDNIYSCLSIGGFYNSAYQVIRQLLHQYTSYNESISLSCLPIYYLEPNTRITVRDEDSRIYGDYMINSISYNLNANSTMSLDCTRALERI